MPRSSRRSTVWANIAWLRAKATWCTQPGSVGVRAGVRYVWKAADKFEEGDIELDGTYESWSTAEGDGDTDVVGHGPSDPEHLASMAGSRLEVPAWRDVANGRSRRGRTVRTGQVGPLAMCG